MFRKVVKRLLAGLMILVLMGGMLPAYAEDTTAGNWIDHISQPALDPADATNKTYTIASGEELAWVASQVNNGNPFIGYTFNVTSDIDLSAHYWTPIGKTNASYSFKGTFNGGGKVISGLTIGSEASPNSTLKNTGLFGFVSGATIKSVNLDKVVIYSSYFGQYPFIGGLAAEAKGATTISDCSVTGLLYCSANGGRIGGILGNYNEFGTSMRLTVANCYSQCAIYSPKVYHAGGLIGHTFSNSNWKANIRNCFAAGSITGGGYSDSCVGGFVGKCQYANIYNCFSNFTVDGRSSNAGGFAGYIYNSSLSNLYAAGLVMNVYTEGGVIGDNFYPHTNNITNCYWNKTINTDTTSQGVGKTENGTHVDNTTAEFQTDMQSSDFLSSLNANAAALVAAGNSDILSWELDPDINSGFPRLSGVGTFVEIYKPIAVGLSISCP